MESITVSENQVCGTVLHERDRIISNVVMLVGKLSDRVINTMLDVPPEPKTVEVVLASAKDDKNDLEQIVAVAVEKAVSQKYADVLGDISYRIGVLQDLMQAAEGKPHRVTSAQLNLAQHMLDGYTVTANSPSTGWIAWSDCFIVYQGSTFAITPSTSSTSQKYVYWVSASVSTFLASNTKPSLDQHDCLVFINENGTPVVAMAPGKFRSGAYLLDGTVGNSELGTGAVTSAKLAASAVFGSHISPSAVTGTHISPSAVSTDKLADSAVTGAKIGAGAVATSKLNIASHMLY